MSRDARPTCELSRAHEPSPRRRATAAPGQRVTSLLAIGTIFALILVSACAKKKPASIYDSAQGTVGEGSLEQYRRGALGDEGPLHDVHFDYDSYELKGDARDALRSNADWLRQNGSGRVEIEGHCDSRGTIEYNLALGAKRASAVREYLVGLGIPADRLTTISYGKELPLCTEENEGCWAQNRRGHSVVLKEVAAR
jgi:peptidoglycan-associated lipoprotein